MDNQLLKYFKLCNQKYKLQNTINYLNNSLKKDIFEYEVLDYANVEIIKVQKKIDRMKSQNNIK